MYHEFIFSIRRRTLAGAVLAVLAFGLAPAFAQVEPPEPAAPVVAETAPAFSFDILTERMRVLSGEPHREARVPGGFAGELNYDTYRMIQFRGERARWQDKDSLFRLHAFHLGWLYKEIVDLFEVVNGVAQPIAFTSDDFEYHGALKDTVPAGSPLDGVAGFRINNPLNRADQFDELFSFVGASYFRALGRDNFYGLSARGLAINTGSADGEEFPRFSEFYIEKPKPGAKTITLYAALESQSVTGAYRFVVSPGEATEIMVTARLFFRSDVDQLGVAPLTSMFLYAENNRTLFDDYRPQVHDSNGLRIAQRDGDVLWRALNNPVQLARSFFGENNPASFGLYQRSRNFADYQDAGAHYERRPSVEVTPIGDWGEGSVELLEIPSDAEVNDNIVAFWLPKNPPKKGEMREFSYKLSWGDLSPTDKATLAHVHETRSGQGGVSGTTPDESVRKFVVDFKGGTIAKLDPDAELTPVTTVSSGEIVQQTLSKIDETDIWRLVMDVRVTGEPLIEMQAHIAGYGQTLSETWLYQWMERE